VINVILIETLSKDMVSLTDGVGSGQEPNTGEVDKIFEEVVKHIMVTTVESTIANQGTA
jgi:hypothetical protein